MSIEIFLKVYEIVLLIFFVNDDTNEQEFFVFHRFVRVTVYDLCLKINIKSAT